jgi:hypothetical protein
MLQGRLAETLFFVILDIARSSSAIHRISFAFGHMGFGYECGIPLLFAIAYCMSQNGLSMALLRLRVAAGVQLRSLMNARSSRRLRQEPGCSLSGRRTRLSGRSA